MKIKLKKLVINKKYASLLFLLAYTRINERIKFFAWYRKRNPKKSPCIVCGNLIIHCRNRKGICSGKCRTRKFRQVHNL